MKTSLVDNIKGAMDNVMKLQGIICFSKTLYVKWIVLSHHKQIRQLFSNSTLKRGKRAETEKLEYLVTDDGNANDHLLRREDHRKEENLQCSQMCKFGSPINEDSSKIFDTSVT